MLSIIFIMYWTVFTFSQNLNDIQEFTINNDADTTIIIKNKTIIKIDKNTFNSTNLVNLKIEEAYEKKEMVLSGLSTETDGNVLLSNGMIKIEAYENSKKIEIINDKNIQIIMPVKQGNKNMDLYVLDSLDSQNWSKNESELKLDSCESYEERIVWRSKKVTRKEYRIWKKNEPIRSSLDKLFGGKSRKNFKKEFYIDVPIDTTWVCLGKKNPIMNFR
ncbi:MAG: hypothetical protein ACI94Y_001800 [Maribacter sp.]|jgi:hypothetical protein